MFGLRKNNNKNTKERVAIQGRCSNGISATTKSDIDQSILSRQQQDENNNNNEFYHSDYNKDISDIDGRISVGSRESAFSSAGSDTSDTFRSGNADDSGFSQDMQGSPMATTRSSTASITSEGEELAETGEKLKLLLEIVIDDFFKFIKIDKKSANFDSIELYDKLDLKALLQPINLGSVEYHMAYKLTIRFIYHLRLSTEFSTVDCLKDGSFSKKNQDSITKVCENLSDLLKFRKHHELNHATLDQFPREFMKLNGIFTFGHDKNNIPVLYISAHVHRRWSPKLDELFKRYVAWHVNRVTGSTLNNTEKLGHFVMCFDCNSIGYSNIDLEFLKFLVLLLLSYYPRSCRLCLIKDNPWVFRSVWSLAKSWLTEEARNAVELITAKQLTDFIPEDQIPNSMKTTNFPSQSIRTESGRFRFPPNYENMRSIDEFANNLDMSQDEIRKLKLHVDKIQQEYKSLGAIA